MTLSTQLAQALAAQGTVQSGDVVHAADPPRRVALKLEALDKLSCALWELCVEDDRLQGMSIDDMKKLSGKLSGKLTYLLEPIAPIEFDADHCLVQMRSSPPQANEDHTSYYELLVSRDGSMRLSRYSAASGQSRAPAAMHLTREVLLRLVGDLSAG